jgi:hypothetical protein
VNGHEHDDAIPAPRRRDHAPLWAAVAAYLSFIVILLVVFNWHRRAVLANHAAILAELAAVRAEIAVMRDLLADQYGYIRARDQSWAAELGWPEPPAMPADAGPNR